MNVKVEQTASLVFGYPTYNIHIDGSDIADSFENVDLSPDMVAEVIKNCKGELASAVESIIAQHVYLNYEPKCKTPVLVRADVTLLMWDLYGCTHETDHAYTSNCSSVLDEVEFDRLPKPDDISQACSDGDMDYVFETGMKYGLFDEWGEAFEVYINEDDYRRYYEVRKAIEG